MYSKIRQEDLHNHQVMNLNWCLKNLCMLVLFLLIYTQPHVIGVIDDFEYT